MFFLVFFLTMVNPVDCLKFISQPFPNESLYVHRKSNVTISCALDDPTVTVELYKRNNLAKDVLGDRIVQFNQDFIIFNLHNSDYAPYYCKANTIGGFIELKKGVLVVVTAACVEQPSIKEGQVKYFGKGENFSITCTAPGSRGNLPKYLQWVRQNNESLAVNEIVESKTEKDEFHQGFIYDVQKLTITNAQEYDAGKYHCLREVLTCSKTTRRNTTIKLRYIAPYVPKIANISGIIYTKLNSNFTVSCSVVSSPQSTIRWMSDEKVVNTCKNADVCMLSWKSTTLANSGNYFCTAENTEGLTNKTFEVVVTVEPVIKTIQTSSDKNVLICQTSSGYPQPNIYWQKQSKCPTKYCDNLWKNVTKYTEISQSVTAVGVQSSINFGNTKEYGKFRCVAVNMAGSSVAELYLSKKDNRITVAMVLIICGILVFVIVTAVLCSCYYHYNTKKKFARFMKPDSKFHLDPDRTLFEQSIELPYAPEWEFPKERLSFISSLGAGAFGQVWLATARGISALCPRQHDTVAMRRRTSLRLNKKVPRKLLQCFLNDDLLDENTFVAVKTLKANPSDVQYKDLASEIKVLIHLGSHDNIVNLLGACTKNGNLCAIIEYCPYGNLVDFLRPRRDIFSLQWARQANDYDEDFCFFDAAYTALQVAKGMLFLSNKKLVHRDLAARNILVGKDYKMKVADFGLSRNIEDKDYYFKESSGMLPVKWMAPESIFDKLYTVKSDVWSFGILLWEIITMGGSPYPGLSMEYLFEYLKTGHRMEQPATCPNELYEIMKLCWQQHLGERPWFNEIVTQLEQIIIEKAQISDNLAAFERLQSCSDECDYLVPRSPVKKKKGSLDTLLDMKNVLTNYNKPRKKSCDVLRFPPTCEKFKNNNIELNGITEQRYVSLATPVLCNDQLVALDNQQDIVGATAV